MLLLLSLFFLFRGSAIEALLIPPREEPSTPNSRTLFSIIWGCLSTTVICAWVSVHPNVPPPQTEECGWRSSMRRLWLMFWTVVAPELVLGWSLRQWYAARKIADMYNKRNLPEQKASHGKWAAKLGSWYRGRVDSKQQTTAWTMTHGHFIVMGGIVLVQPEDNVDGTTGADESESDPNAERKPSETILDMTMLEHADDSDPNADPNADSDPIADDSEALAGLTDDLNAERKPTETILDMTMLEELLKDPNFKITITEEELEDKAKGDFLSKGIVILQVSWFIIQCVARFIQGLAITELEVATLALASMNGFMYFFWWNKPLGINVPVKINLKHDVPPRGEGDQGRTTVGVLNSIREVLVHFKSDDTAVFICILLILLLLLPLVIFGVLIALISIIFGALYDVMQTNAIPSDATHVPAFYSPKTNAHILSYFVIFPIFSLVFGGLHCLCWNFAYPSQIERTIWRVASLAITVPFPASVLLFVFFAIIGAIIGSLIDVDNGILGKITGIIMDTTLYTGVVLGCLLAFVYVLARIILLVEALFLLRSQPADAFRDVDWTKFIPHV